MDDTTKKIMLTIGAGLLRKGGLAIGMAAAAHGWIAGNDVELCGAVAVAVGSAGYSLWKDYGKAILLSQLEVLKAKSLAQAAKMRDAGVSPVTVSQIADQSARMTPADVAKAVAKLPAEVQANVAPAKAVMSLLLLAAAGLWLTTGSAHAATVTPAPKACLIPFDPLKLCGALTGNAQEDLQRVAQRIAKVGKADLTYAAAKAKAANTNGSAVRLQCIQAIADANDQANGAGLKNADGSAMVRPDPALVTAIEDLAELVDDLSPQGKLLTSCSGAAEMMKLNGLQAINAIVTGATALVAAPAGL